MDMKMGARLGAVVFVAVAVTAGMIDLTREESRPSPATSQPSGAPLASDPLQRELRRCQLLGENGPRDGACLKAWARSRSRFLGVGASPSQPAAPDRSEIRPAPDPARFSSSPQVR